MTKKKEQVKAYTAVPTGDEVLIKPGKENNRYGRLVPLLAIVVGLVTLAVLMPCDHHHHDRSSSSYSPELRPEEHDSVMHSMMRGFHSSGSDSSSSDSSSDSEDRSWHHHHGHHHGKMHGEMMHMHHDGDQQQQQHMMNHMMGNHHMYHTSSDSEDQELAPPPLPVWFEAEEDEFWEEDNIGESLDYAWEDGDIEVLDVDDGFEDDAWVIDAENDFEQSGMDDEAFYDLSGDMIEVPPEAYDEGVEMIVEEMEDAEIPVKEERMEEPGD